MLSKVFLDIKRCDSTLILSNTGKKQEARLSLVADFVIEAISRPEFEDGMRTGGCWCHCGDQTWPRINSNPSFGV